MKRRWKFSKSKRTARRDPEQAKSLRELNHQLRKDYGLHNWQKEHTQVALVLADSLNEKGFGSVANELSRFAKRQQKWMDENRKKNGFLKWDHPGAPQHKQWVSIGERIDDAIREVYKRKPHERLWPQRRPLKATLVLVHRYGGPPTVRGPFPITPKDAENLVTIRKWLAKDPGLSALGKLRNEWKNREFDPLYSHMTQDFGRVELHRNGDKLTVFPEKGWHSVTIELGQSRRREAGREIEKMIRFLKGVNSNPRYEQAPIPNPTQAARKLWRVGITSEQLDRMDAKDIGSALAMASRNRYGTFIK